MGLEIRVLTYDNHRNVAGFNRKMAPQPFSLNKCISNEYRYKIYNNKETQQIHFHSQRSHTITNMNDNINMNSTIARPMNKNEGI